MYAITGITGKVGGALARALLADRRPVRAVVRDIEKGLFWAAQGCEIALAEMQDSASELLQENWIGKRVVELEGPKRISPQEIGTGFAKILGHAVRVEAVPRETW